MSQLVSVSARLDNALEALQPLLVGAQLDEDAAFARLQTGRIQTEIVAAKRVINSLIGSLALATRRMPLPDAPQQIPGLLVIDGAPELGTTAQGERVLVTFDRAARVPRNPWPPAERRS